jgi:hypothetical protein
MIPRPRIASRLAAPLLAAVAVAALTPAAAGAQAAPPAEWRTSRWGMTLDEVLRAFPGEAKKLDAPIQLADGNVVAAGIDAHVLAGTTFRVRFVFDAAGKLVIVSLRTGEKDYAKPELLAPIEKALADRLGPPAERSNDQEFIDMRQVTWKGPTGRVDLKYVPGTIVVMHAAPSQQPPGPAPAPR